MQSQQKVLRYMRITHDRRADGSILMSHIYIRDQGGVYTFSTSVSVKGRRRWFGTAIYDERPKPMRLSARYSKQRAEAALAGI